MDFFKYNYTVTINSSPAISTSRRSSGEVIFSPLRFSHQMLESRLLPPPPSPQHREDTDESRVQAIQIEAPSSHGIIRGSRNIWMGVLVLLFQPRLYQLQVSTG